MNRKAREPICHPRSAIMNIPTNPADWDEEWFTTWQARKENPHRLEQKKRGKKSKRIKSYVGDDDESCFVGLPEIGSIYTIRFRIGERVSRVHYDYTSSLRKSRWKKKYFPKGIFGTSM